LALGLTGAMAGCHAGPSATASRPTVGQTAVQASAADGPDALITFFDDLEARPLAAQDDAIHAALLLGTGRSGGSYAERVAMARELGYLPKGFDRPGNQAVTIGEVSAMLARVLGQTPPDQASAVRALVSRGALPATAEANQGLTGAQLVSMVGMTQDAMAAEGVARVEAPVVAVAAAPKPEAPKPAATPESAPAPTPAVAQAEPAPPAPVAPAVANAPEQPDPAEAVQPTPLRSEPAAVAQAAPTPAVEPAKSPEPAAAPVVTAQVQEPSTLKNEAPPAPAPAPAVAAAPKAPAPDAPAVLSTDSVALDAAAKTDKVRVAEAGPEAMVRPTPLTNAADLTARPPAPTAAPLPSAAHAEENAMASAGRSEPLPEIPAGTPAPPLEVQEATTKPAVITPDGKVAGAPAGAKPVDPKKGGKQSRGNAKDEWVFGQPLKKKSTASADESK
jgi:hypothetical protein